MAAPETTKRAKPRPGDELELAVDKLAHGGAGVGRAEGFVVFVRGAVPGDRVRARVGKAKRSFAEAGLVELLEASPDRIERWDVIDDLSQDILASERVDEVREAVREWCRERKLEPYDRESHEGYL